MLDGETSSPVIIPTLNPKSLQSHITSRHVAEGNLDAESGEFGELPNVLENEELNMKSSGGSNNTIRPASSRKSEQSPNKTSKSEKVLPIKRTHSSLVGPAKRCRQFKPPRMLRSQRNARGSPSGGMQSPIEIDDFETPVSDSKSTNVQCQIDEDEMLARVLQEEYSLEDSGRNTSMVNTFPLMHSFCLSYNFI
mgnify:FL=1